MPGELAGTVAPSSTEARGVGRAVATVPGLSGVWAGAAWAGTVRALVHEQWRRCRDTWRRRSSGCNAEVVRTMLRGSIADIEGAPEDADDTERRGVEGTGLKPRLCVMNINARSAGPPSYFLLACQSPVSCNSERCASPTHSTPLPRAGPAAAADLVGLAQQCRSSVLQAPFGTASRLA